MFQNPRLGDYEGKMSGKRGWGRPRLTLESESYSSTGGVVRGD